MDDKRMTEIRAQVLGLLFEDMPSKEQELRGMINEVCNYYDEKVAVLEAENKRLAAGKKPRRDFYVHGQEVEIGRLQESLKEKDAKILRLKERGDEIISTIKQMASCFDECDLYESGDCDLCYHGAISTKDCPKEKEPGQISQKDLETMYDEMSLMEKETPAPKNTCGNCGLLDEDIDLGDNDDGCCRHPRMRRYARNPRDKACKHWVPKSAPAKKEGSTANPVKKSK
jgi:hypothetical protein